MEIKKHTGTSHISPGLFGLLVYSSEYDVSELRNHFSAEHLFTLCYLSTFAFTGTLISCDSCFLHLCLVL